MFHQKALVLAAALIGLISFVRPSFGQTGRPGGDPPGTKPPAKPVVGRDINQARELARTIIIESGTIKSSDSNLNERLKQWMDAAKRCNLSLSAPPACLNPGYNLVDQASFTLNENHLFVAIYNPKKGAGFFNQLVLVRKDASHPEPVRVRLMITQKKYSGDTLRQWLDNGEYVSQIEAKVSSDPMAISLKRISQGADAAQFYYGLLHLSSLTKPQGIKSRVAEIIQGQMQALVLSKSDESYKQASFRLIEKQFEGNAEVLRALGRAMMSSQSDALKEYGALLLAQSGLIDDGVRNRIWSALKSSDQGRRLSALRAVAKLKLSKREENQLLEMLVDPAAEIRETVTAIVEKLNLDNSNLISIQSMLRDPNEDIRHTAMTLIGRIVSPESTALLIESLVDESARVRLVARQSLQTRNITQREVPALQRQLYMPNPIFRLSALELLLQIQTQEIRLILLPLMFDEAPEVRELARKGVQQRGVRDSDLEQLRPFLNNINSSHRLFALQLVAKMTSSLVRTLILPMMFDESFEVREEARKILKAKGFTTADISMLEPYLSNANPAYRQFALACIGQVPGAEAQKILIPLMFDDVAQVREEARSMMSKRSLLNSDLEALRVFVEDSNPNFRVFALSQVSRIASDEATSLLIMKLVDEAFDVRQQANLNLISRSLKASHFQELGQVLNSKSKAHRLIATVTLGQIPNKEAESLLIERLIEENESDVQSELRKAIKSLREKMKKTRGQG